jgi:RHS repeat-associated protein
VSRIGFAGSWTDPASGLLYLRARDYDPVTGQFLLIDPAVASTGQPYAYAGNSPLLHTDPSGLCPVNGGPDLPDCTPEDFGGNSFLLSAPLLAIGDFLRPANSSFAGFADGATGGLSELARDATGTNCYVEKNGWYWTEYVFGVAASLVTGGAAVRAFSAIGRAFQIGSVFEASSPITRIARLLPESAPKVLGLGSTGRQLAANLTELFAMAEVRSAPAGQILQRVTMSDPRWLAGEGWVKMQQIVNGVNIHYVRNVINGLVDDFKFKF